MSFATWQYIVFLGICLASVRLLRGGRGSRVFLLVASCAFYGFFEIRLIPVLLGMAAATYYIARLVARATNPGRRKAALLLGIMLNLSVLGLFKYFNFFAQSLAALFRTQPPQSLGLILPVGISFVTFEVLSYLMDTYRGEPESPSLLDFTLLVMFFPHLVAGPILKPRQFLPQLESSLDVSWGNIERAMPQFLIGLCKKVLIADSLAAFVDPVFARPAFYSSTTVWLAAIAYALQIYCDFSGYSDMAIASARCFGLDIPANFNMPYLARSVTEFWRRWHISLSSWFRVYVYFPLGGNRFGLTRTCFNTMAVMLLSGLWHGAGWNFVLWGGLHGAAMVMQRVYRSRFPDKSARPYSRLRDVSSWLATMLFLCFTWVIFRNPDFSVALLIIQKMLFVGRSSGIQWIPSALLVSLPVVVASHWIGVSGRTPNRLVVLSFSGAATLTVIVFGLLVFAPEQASPFIYFQF